MIKHSPSKSSITTSLIEICLSGADMQVIITENPLPSRGISRFLNVSLKISKVTILPHSLRFQNTTDGAHASFNFTVKSPLPS